MKLKYDNGITCLYLEPVLLEQESFYKHVLPIDFFLCFKGYYTYNDQLWPFLEEGLYSFYDDNDIFICHHYFYKNNVKMLSNIIFKLCTFSKKDSDAVNFDVINRFLVKNEFVNGISIKSFFYIILFNLGIAFRFSGMYSLNKRICIGNFIEVYDEKKSVWFLYWLEKAVFIAETSKHKDVFSVFDELSKDIFHYEAIVDISTFYNKNDISDDDSIKLALLNNREVIENIKSEEVFLVSLSEGIGILKANTRKEYAKYFDDKDMVTIALWDNNRVSYNVYFLDNDELLTKLYGTQLYIVKGNAVFIGDKYSKGASNV